MLSALAPANSLNHVFPTSGLFGFEMKSFASYVAVAVGKLVAISFTVAAGYCGGYIFPFFATGAALGKALTAIITSISVPVARQYVS